MNFLFSAPFNIIMFINSMENGEEQKCDDNKKGGKLGKLNNAALSFPSCSLIAIEHRIIACI